MTNKTSQIRGSRKMTDSKHSVLCVDDEQNILNSLKRLLRKEPYNVFTASSGPEGLEILKENEVHVVMSDQRMPEMSGTEFLATVKEKYPDTVRIVLTGYTEVDAITDSVNKGHVYKFFLKPWNDDSLKLEIRKALEQYDLVEANRTLDRKVLEQNEELKTINENLESIVQERTKEIEIQNQVLELSRAILEYVPVPIVGVGAEGIIAVTNQEAQGLAINGQTPAVGRELVDLFSTDVQESVTHAMETGDSQAVTENMSSDGVYDITVTPLSGRFRGKGVILTLQPAPPAPGSA